LKKRIYVTATNTDIGKTYTTKLLLKHYASLGYKVGVIKPIETGVVDGYYPDGSELFELVKELNSAFNSLFVSDIVPFSYEFPSAPYIASKAKKLDLTILNAAVEKLEQRCDILIIEGAGGLYVPIDDAMMMIDMIKHLDVVTLLVTHCSLGCINDTLLSKKALDDMGIKNIVAFNCKDEDKSFSTVSQPYFTNSKENRIEVLKVSSDIDTISQLLYNL